MYRDRGGSAVGGSSKSELERKRITTDALDKHLDKSSSKNVAIASGSGSKDRERLDVSKAQYDLRDPRDADVNGHEKNKVSEG